MFLSAMPTAGPGTVGQPAPARHCIDAEDWLPHLRGLQVERVTCTDVTIWIDARTAPAQAACSGCGVPSSRVHSGYVRQIQDGPAGGRPVVIRLAVRRLFCRNSACPVVTFAEQVEGLTGRYRRRSLPLPGLLARSGWRAGGPGRGPGWPRSWVSRCIAPRW